MKTLRLVIALALAMPLVAFSASLAPAHVSGAAAPAGTERTVAEGACSQDGCCWVYILGDYYCVPC